MIPMTILVADDEPAQRELLGGFLAKRGWSVELAAGGAEALAALRRTPVDLVLADYRMPDLSGIELLRASQQLNPEVPVVLITAYGSIASAVEAMKAGAYDYLTKPIELEELVHLIHRIAERRQLLAEVQELRTQLRERFRFEGIIGESGHMQEVLSLVARVAPTPSTVLIRGESGTGKELIAKAIHYNSPRHDRPFLKVNVSALPETLMESELFGHEKGAFTGAMERRIGRFEAADGGTLFLDEIGDLPLALQVKFLRVLQEREIERLGTQRPIAVDIRILAATNQDLERAVRERRFREDLYYRLNVFPIVLPPLRERREDIPLLIEFLLQKFAARLGKPITAISRQAMDVLMKYDYPGNVRELENILERAIILARHEAINVEDLPLHLREPTPEDAGETHTGQASLPEVLHATERQLLRRALERHSGVQTRAAAELGISERVLRYKLRKHHLHEEVEAGTGAEAPEDRRHE
ncbi:MAG TPA: sigma-54 dependent transcriptional regulator [Candidatus Tectomicrobia bacterium]|nr:sigma-54 dependent transcriptional regulator [Candidatus Tectomicrobia bacterium]